MRLDKGKPSGVNKSRKGTGVPAKLDPRNEKRNRKVTDKYTDNDEDIADHVRQKNPNRNVDKTGSTNAGGYRN